MVTDHRAQRAGTFTSQSDCAHLQGIGYFHGGQHIFGAAAGGEGYEDISWTAKGLHLAGKNLFKAVVVAEAGERGSVDGQCDGRPARAFAAEAPYQFGCEVLGVGSAATVAAYQYLAARAQGIGQEFRNDDNSGGELKGCPADDVTAFDEFGDCFLFGDTAPVV